MPENKELDPVSPTMSGNDRVRNLLDSKETSSLMQSASIMDAHKVDWFNNFTRYGIIDPYNAMSNTREYLFFTRPDLHIVNPSNPTVISHGLRNNPFFRDFIQRFPELVYQLQSSCSINRSRNPFMAILSNAVTSGMDLPSISADMIDTPANAYGTRIQYRGVSMKSHENHEFNLEFTDTKYLEVYHLFKAFDEYKSLELLGYLQPSNTIGEDAIWIEYIMNKVLYDHITIYKIVVGEDGTSIVFMGRVTGVVPTGVPRDAFSDMTNMDGQKLTVPWNGFYVRDSDPRIVSDFNRITKRFRDNQTKRDLPLYDMENHRADGRLSKCPYIYINDANVRSPSAHMKMQKYYLKWRI